MFPYVAGCLAEAPLHQDLELDASHAKEVESEIGNANHRSVLGTSLPACSLHESSARQHSPAEENSCCSVYLLVPHPERLEDYRHYAF